MKASPWPYLTKLLLEAASVVFAVLVALAVDEWWEERENRQRAELALEAVASEMRSNRRDLVDFGGASDPDTMMTHVAEALAAYRAGGEPEGDLALNWDVTLLSTAAWETARLTNSAQYLGLERLVELAEVYEFQRYYLSTQDEVVREISGVAARMESEPVAALRGVQADLAMALALRRTLATLYACNLVELEGAQAVEPGACPEAEVEYGPGTDSTP